MQGPGGENVQLITEKLTEGIDSVVRVLHLDQKYESLDQMKLEIIVQLILNEMLLGHCSVLTTNY